MPEAGKNPAPAKNKWIPDPAVAKAMAWQAGRE